MSTTNNIAATWLRQALAGGPVAVRAIQQSAKSAGIDWEALTDARHALGVEELERQWRLAGGPAQPSSITAPAVQTTSTTPDVRASVLAERARIEAIIGSPEADGREDLAKHIAFRTDEAAASATVLLAAAARQKSAGPNATPRAAPKANVAQTRPIMDAYAFRQQQTEQARLRGNPTTRGPKSFPVAGAAYRPPADVNDEAPTAA